MIILCIFNINYILLEISGSHSNIFIDSYVFHYGNELVSRTGNKGIRHFVTTNYDQKYPFAEVGEIACCLPQKKQQNFSSLSRFRFCADRAQNLPGPAGDSVLKSAPNFIQISLLPVE